MVAHKAKTAGLVNLSLNKQQYSLVTLSRQDDWMYHAAVVQAVIS